MYKKCCFSVDEEDLTSILNHKKKAKSSRVKGKNVKGKEKENGGSGDVDSSPETKRNEPEYYCIDDDDSDDAPLNDSQLVILQLSLQWPATLTIHNVYSLQAHAFCNQHICKTVRKPV